MIELEEALDLLVNSVKTNTKTEKLDILSAFGKICAEDVIAAIPVPHFPKSAMDGYAVRSQDTKGASKENAVQFQVIGEVCAGDFVSLAASPFTAVRVMTGGMVPEGYDCVIRQEDTDYGQEQVEIYVEGRQWENYCRIGEDIEAGRHIISKGTHLTSGHVGILASLGIREITVFQMPRVGIISTGNELVPLNQPISEVGVYPSSAYTIASRLKAKGIEVPFMEICGDDAQKFSDMLDERIEQADVIVTTGAISVGKKDFLPEALEGIGAQRIFHRVNMRPGTPVMACRYKEKVILSLSGYPFAAMVNFQIFFWPVVARLMGDESLSWKKMKIVVAEGSTKVSKKRRFLQAFADESGVHIYDRNQHSSVLSEIIYSNCIIDQKQGTGISPGDTVEIICWSEE
ncbi:MAG: molybdopterin molybdotransferase MoeA [Muricomes sp.]